MWWKILKHLRQYSIQKQNKTVEPSQLADPGWERLSHGTELKADCEWNWKISELR
jgi:hypothetical protein